MPTSAASIAATAQTASRPRFLNDHDPSDATLLLMVLTKVSGTRHHEPSAQDAHHRNAAFFNPT